MSNEEGEYLILKLNLCWKLRINVLRNLGDIFYNIMPLFMLQITKTDMNHIVLCRKKYLLFKVTIKY